MLAAGGITASAERHCQVDVLGDKLHAIALAKLHPVASIRLLAGQSVIDECGLIKSADYAPRLELLHHLACSENGMRASSASRIGNDSTPAHAWIEIAAHASLT